MAESLVTGIEDIGVSVMTLRKVTDLAERAQAISQAGFKAMGLRLSDYEMALDSMHSQEITKLLAKYDVAVPEIEFLREWIGMSGDPQYDDEEERLFAMADQLGSRHINVGVFDKKYSFSDVTTAYRGLCKRAGEHGLIVQIEPMPYTPPVDSLPLAQRVVESARESDQLNAGLLVDVWHYMRMLRSAEALVKVPPELITGVQLGDVMAQPLSDVVQEARHHRAVPGEGVVDLQKFLKTLGDHGCQDVAVGVEIMSDNLDAMDPALAMRRVTAGLQKALSLSNLTAQE